MKIKNLINNSKRKFINFIVVALFILIIFPVVLAVPPLPTEIYGEVNSFNMPAPSGTLVSVYDSLGNLCGTYTTKYLGYFGVMSCNGKDEFNAGPKQNELLNFKVNSAPASVVVFQGILPGYENIPNASKLYGRYNRSEITWETGKFKEIILVSPPLVCGDLFCDKYENCNTCPGDCGSCAQANQTNQNNTNGSSSSGSSGGSSGGSSSSGSSSNGGSGGSSSSNGGGNSGGSSSSGGSSGAAAGANAGAGATGNAGQINQANQNTQSGGANNNQEQVQQTECEESWQCSDWGICIVDNIADNGGGKGTQNRDCADVNKCGTSKSMPDLVKDCYVSKEELMNQSINETKVPPRIEHPSVISVCKERLSIFSLQSIVFILLILIVLLIAEIDYRQKIKRIEADKKLDELKKLELKYLEKRKKYVFFVVVFVLSFIVYLYHYLFFLCKDKYINFLWLLAIGVFITPFIVHFVLKYTKYGERQKDSHLLLLNDAHYKHVIALLKIANQELIYSENRITASIYVLEQKKEFNELLSKEIVIREIYTDMTKLFNLYKTLKNPMAIERDLLNNIKGLEQDKLFVEAAKTYPEFADIRSKLSLLYAAYESKQGLYDELSNIELVYGIKERVVR